MDVEKRRSSLTNALDALLGLNVKNEKTNGSSSNVESILPPSSTTDENANGTQSTNANETEKKRIPRPVVAERRSV